MTAREKAAFINGLIAASVYLGQPYPEELLTAVAKALDFPLDSYNGGVLREMVEEGESNLNAGGFRQRV